jgi:hypothetical protein
MLRPVHEPASRDARQAVGDGLNRQQQADLGVGKAQVLLAEDRQECADSSPGQRRRHQADDDRAERALGDEPAEWFHQCEPLARLRRGAGRHGARNREHEQCSCHSDVSSQVEPLEQQAGDRWADEEAGLHREREPAHRTPEPAAGHQGGDSAEQRCLLGAGSKAAHDLPNKQGRDGGGLGHGQLRSRRNDQGKDQKRPRAESVDENTCRHRQ